MGLDMTEMIMDLEEVFGIPLPACETEGMRTVGDLVAYILHRVRGDTTAGCATSRTFYRLRRELMGCLPLTRHDVRPARTWVAMVLPGQRRRVWQQLHAAGWTLPPLHLSWSARIASALLVFGLGIGAALWLHAPLLLTSLLPLGLGAWLATRPLAICVPGPIGTLRTTVLYLAPAAHPSRTECGTIGLSNEEIAAKVRLLISHHLGLPLKDIRDDARFVEDLGC
jgi:acyl carrier protein